MVLGAGKGERRWTESEGHREWLGNEYEILYATGMLAVQQSNSRFYNAKNEFLIYSNLGHHYVNIGPANISNTLTY